MEFIIAEKKKNRLLAQLIGADHTVCNLIVDELNQDKNIENAAYAIDHPLVGKPKIVIQTNGADPLEALSSACKRIKKNLADIGKSFDA